MAKQKLSPVMSDAAFEVLAKLDKPTLVDLVWTLTPKRGAIDEHATLQTIDTYLRAIDAWRQQRPKMLAAKYAEGRVAAAQGGAVVTKQVRVRLTPRRKANP